MADSCHICKLKWKCGQKSIKCTSCLGWLHDNNRGSCSGLTNKKFEIHVNDRGNCYTG